MKIRIPEVRIPKVKIPEVNILNLIKSLFGSFRITGENLIKAIAWILVIPFILVELIIKNWFILFLVLGWYYWSDISNFIDSIPIQQNVIEVTERVMEFEREN